MKQILFSIMFTIPVAIANSITTTNTTVTIPSVNNAIDFKSKIDSIDVTKFKKQHYIQNIKDMMPVFQLISEESNVPIDIPIVFFAWESGWGRSSVFQKGYNMGGVMKTRTTYYYYNSLYDSALSWAKVLGHERYTKRFKDKNDFKDLLLAYHYGGYWDDNLDQIKWRMTIYNQLKGKF